jgi:hypothetical protein
MGFVHPGLYGVYDPNSLVMPRFVPTPVLYTCEVCNRNFRALEELLRHRFEQRPVRLPVLLIRGRPVGGTPSKIQPPLSPPEVVIADCSRCWVDERLIDVDSLRLLLADATTVFHVIRRSNEGAQPKATLDYQVAREHDLSGVKWTLARLASRRTLTLMLLATLSLSAGITRRAFHTATAFRPTSLVSWRKSSCLDPL